MKISFSGAGLLHAWTNPLPQRLRRVMKLTSLLLIVTSLHLSAHSYSQRVSFSGKNVPLQTVFASIEKQTGLAFFFNYTLIKDTKPVTVEVHNVLLEDALKEILKDQALDFYREGKTIFIVRKQASSNLPIPSSADERMVDAKGRVINQQGEPLVAATVSEKSGKKSTLTDEKGGFEVKNVPVGTVLEVSFLGYQNKSVEVHGGEVVTVQLVLANNQLDEAHVIAYGQTSQRLSTANITMVKGEEIEKQPVSNPLLALEGRVPGLYITQTNGLPGSGVTVRIQGQNSIVNGNDPLYVIDGVPYVSQLLTTTLGTQLGSSGSSTAGLNGNPMSYINPADIESVEVLKDADATAIYGSRAANGAILITTKKGKAGVTKVDLNFQNGWGGITRKMPLLNTPQYLEMRHEAMNNDGIASPGFYDFDINGAWDTTRNTDWQKVLIGGTARYTNVNGSVSGGNVNTQYLIGGTYHRETTVFPGNYKDVKGNLHFSINTVSTNQRLKMQFTGSYMYDDNKLPLTDLTGAALTLPPDAPAVFKPDGTLNWQLNSTGGPTWLNPFATVYYTPYENKTYNLISNGVLSYQILPGLEIRSNLGYTRFQSNEIYKIELPYSDPATQSQSGTNARSAAYSYNTIESWIIEPQASYKKALGNSTLETVIGGTLSEIQANGSKYTGRGYTSDALLGDPRSAATMIFSPSVITEYKYTALFGRIKYNWKNKYIADLVARRDGSSRFGPARQFHDFASAGLAWIFSQEGILRNNFPALSFGKIRGSYGTTGSDQIKDYQYLNLYSSISAQVPYQGGTGLGANNIPNPYLQWEQTRKLQAALELGFWQNRLLFTATYVLNRSSNELLNANIPVITGFSFITENLPAVVQNTAGEFMLNANIVKGKNFNWDCSANLTIPKNRLVSYHSQIPAGVVVVGQPLGIAELFHSIGVDPTTGTYLFSDSHGNATSTPDATNDATKYISTSFPSYYGGLQNSFRYKQVQLDFLFQFVKSIANNYFFGAGFPGTSNTNQPTFVLNRWQKPGDLTSTQRFSTDFNLYMPWLNETLSDAAISDASFIRLKNVSISYQVSGRVLRAAHFQGMRLYIQGQNLLTITKFKGLDPETGNLGLPPLRVITIGLQVGL